MGRLKNMEDHVAATVERATKTDQRKELALRSIQDHGGRDPRRAG
jgi:hypothetical protein